MSVTLASVQAGMRRASRSDHCCSGMQANGPWMQAIPGIEQLSPYSPDEPIGLPANTPAERIGDYPWQRPRMWHGARSRTLKLFSHYELERLLCLALADRDLPSSRHWEGSNGPELILGDGLHVRGNGGHFVVQHAEGERWDLCACLCIGDQNQDEVPGRVDLEPGGGRHLAVLELESCGTARADDRKGIADHEGYAGKARNDANEGHRAYNDGKA